MNDEGTVNVGTGLIGMPVIIRDTGKKAGDVYDALLHPTEGRMLGLLVRTPENDDLALRAFAAADAVIGPDAVMILGDMPSGSDAMREALASGVQAAHELVGTSVVTGEGTLLGAVSEVHISLKHLRAFYRVTGSALQRFFGGGFYLPADLARSYSRDGARMIVPPEAESAHAYHSLAEAVRGRPNAASRPG